jgi:uncharacterized glyoxalase superfamily protein PhnB
MSNLTEDLEGSHTITVHLVCRDAGRAADWYVKALGAEGRDRLQLPDGRFMQIELRFDDSTVMIADEFPEMSVVSPLTVGGVSSTLHLQTRDVDALWERALQEGAPMPSSRCRTCSGATVTPRSSTRSATDGRLPSTSATSPRANFDAQPQRRSEAPETTAQWVTRPQ